VKWLAILVLVLAAAAGGYVLRVETTSASASSSATASSVPSCPHVSYGADGNIAPLFGRIDNPLAIHYYGSVEQKLLALGPSATPDEIATLMQQAHVVPFSWACNEYALAAWAEHWQFGTNPINGC
jgi:hypothetical protein